MITCIEAVDVIVFCGALENSSSWRGRHSYHLFSFGAPTGGTRGPAGKGLVTHQQGRFSGHLCRLGHSPF
jgi:hypothetical protein